MPELTPAERFRAYEAAAYELSGLKRDGTRSFFRLAQLLRRIERERLYAERFATFERFLAAGAGLPVEEGLRLARAADLFDPTEAAELGREKVLALAALPREQVRALLS
ncbi:MAG: hypothetical protein ACK4N5_13870, partial [Myxococcales bacterium]